MENVTFGPFSGYASSVERFNTPADKITSDSSDVRRDPFTGGWYRRKGTTAVLSSSTTGVLESKWSARARQGLELVSPSLTVASTSVVSLGRPHMSEACAPNTYGLPASASAWATNPGVLVPARPLIPAVPTDPSPVKPIGLLDVLDGETPNLASSCWS